jgi:pyruvate dehydrogenase E1 component alpha subunit
MTLELIKECKLYYLQVLDEQGNCDSEQDPNLSNDDLKKVYENMLFIKLLDEKLFNLQRSGKIGTYAQTKGQEACQIGSAFFLQEQDWVAPSFRELGVFLQRGANLKDLVQAWNGDTRAFINTINTHHLPIGIPIASQCLHACGIAWASKLKKEQAATITFIGDGGTSEGDFHEALNFASTLQLPVVFFCQNNGWAISTQTQQEMHSETVAQKGFAYDMECIKVDGNDVLAVLKATKEALERARKGEGPTLIEAKTYRLGDHTTSDDSLKYRTQEEIEKWEKKNPFIRFEKYLSDKGIFSNEWKQELTNSINQKIEQAVQEATSVEKPNPSDLFNNVFTEKPWNLQEQEQDLLEELKEIEQENGGNEQ